MPVTALFAMAPKTAAIGVLCRLITGPLAPVFEQTQQILIMLSIASMAVGSFAAIAQHNVKRLMAYSSIGHVGFIMMALAVGGMEGIQTALFYTVIYVLMSAGAFAVLLAAYDNREGAGRNRGAVRPGQASTGISALFCDFIAVHGGHPADGRFFG